MAETTQTIYLETTLGATAVEVFLEKISFDYQVFLYILDKESTEYVEIPKAAPFLEYPDRIKTVLDPNYYKIVINYNV